MLIFPNYTNATDARGNCSNIFCCSSCLSSSLNGTPGTTVTPAFDPEDCGYDKIRVGYGDLDERVCSSESGHCEVDEVIIFLKKIF